jgi:DNA helicase-2/ATP-dependent DNA helicase PcrA
MLDKLRANLRTLLRLGEKVGEVDRADLQRGEERETELRPKTFPEEEGFPEVSVREDDPLLAPLTEEQRKAVTTTKRHVLVVAGPGSGKTRTIVHRAAWMVDRFGIPPQDIVLITFTTKAAQEMRERLEAFLGERAEEILVSTFHAYGLRLLKQASVGEVQLLDEAGQARLWGEAWKKVATEEDKERNLRSLVTEIGRRLGSGERLTPLQARLLEAYEALKREQGVIDFEDLLRIPLEKDADVRARPHFLLDEAQDINWGNLAFVRRFALSLYAVGDSRQAIYGWRGSDPTIMERLGEFYPGIATYHLSVNHRSPERIVKVAEEVLQRVSPKKYPPLKAKRKGGRVEFIRTSSWKEDVLAAADVVASAVERWGYESVAVLYRGKRAGKFNLYQALVEVMGQKQIPVGGERTLGQSKAFAFLKALLLYGISPSSAKGKLEPFLPADLRELLRQGKALDERLAFTERGQAIQNLYLAMVEGPQSFLEAIQGPSLLTALLGDRTDPLLLGEVRALRRVLALVEEPVSYWDVFDALEERASRSYPDGVALLTAHASKGLEYPVVVVVGIREGGFPSSSSPIEEEARVAFVALTRASEELFLIGSERSPFGFLSRFLADEVGG